MTMLALVTYLAAQGCALACASGIISNLERESGLDPAAHSATGSGLPQWAGPRRQRMMRALGLHWRDGFGQLRHIVVELTEFGVRDRLFAEADPAVAAGLFFHGFEWPDKRRPVPEGCEGRARAIYREFALGATP